MAGPGGHDEAGRWALLMSRAPRAPAGTRAVASSLPLSLPASRPGLPARSATAPPGRTATSVQAIRLPVSATWGPAARGLDGTASAKNPLFKFHALLRTYGRREPDRPGEKTFGAAVPGTATSAAATAGPPSARRWCRMRRRTASSRSVGIGRAFFEATAGVDESFVRDGGADTECAGRAQVRRRAARAGAACRRRSGAGGRARARAPRADAGRGGAGVPWTDPGRGIRAAWHARGRLGHEDGGFRERGLSGTLRGGLASAAHPAIACYPACAPGGPRGSAAGLQPIASRAPARPGGNCPVPPLQTS